MAARPGTVTLVAVLAIVNGILNILGGVVVLFTRDAVARAAGDGAAAAITASAIISILLGVITIVVARGLLRGSPTARAVVTIVMIVDILNGILLMFTPQLVSGIVQILWSLLIIALLFTRRASAFFGSR
jgi:hypothetical protein